MQVGSLGVMFAAVVTLLDTFQITAHPMTAPTSSLVSPSAAEYRGPAAFLVALSLFALILELVVVICRLFLHPKYTPIKSLQNVSAVTEIDGYN